MYSTLLWTYAIGGILTAVITLICTVDVDDPLGCGDYVAICLRTSLIWPALAVMTASLLVNMFARAIHAKVQAGNRTWSSGALVCSRCQTSMKRNGQYCPRCGQKRDR